MPKPSWAKINIGEYTGDGATSQAITGIGFRPQRLRIFVKKTVDNTKMNSFETNTKIVAWHANGGCVTHTTDTANNHQFDTDKILSLDVDGFTVGDNSADQNPNKSGEVYAYEAMG